MKNHKLSVASAMYDKGNKGYLNADEKVMRALDVDGDGEISKGELLNAAKLFNAKERQAKRMIWIAGGLILVIVLLVAALFGVVVSANEVISPKPFTILFHI